MAAADGMQGELLTHAEAAVILHVHTVTVDRLVARGELETLRPRSDRQLPRAAVEALAVSRWSSRRTRTPSLVDTEEAAVILGVTRARVVQLGRV